MRYLIFTFFILITFAVVADYYLSLSIESFRTGLSQEQALKFPVARPLDGSSKVSSSPSSTSTYLKEGGSKRFLGPTVKPFIIGPTSPPPGAK